MYAVIRNYEDEAADVVARLKEHTASLREVMSGIDWEKGLMDALPNPPTIVQGEVAITAAR
jgi:hypothetical protein